VLPTGVEAPGTLTICPDELVAAGAFARAASTRVFKRALSVFVGHAPVASEKNRTDSMRRVLLSARLRRISPRSPASKVELARPVIGAPTLADAVSAAIGTPETATAQSSVMT
jgi:hypothetical protein